MGDEEVEEVFLKILVMKWVERQGSNLKGMWLLKKGFIKMGVIRVCLNVNRNDLVEKEIFKM